MRKRHLSVTFDTPSNLFVNFDKPFLGVLHDSLKKDTNPISIFNLSHEDISKYISSIHKTLEFIEILKEKLIKHKNSLKPIILIDINIVIQSFTIFSDIFILLVNEKNNKKKKILYERCCFIIKQEYKKDRYENCFYISSKIVENIYMKYQIIPDSNGITYLHPDIETSTMVNSVHDMTSLLIDIKNLFNLDLEISYK